jgi:hypothetical protein
MLAEAAAVVRQKISGHQEGRVRARNGAFGDFEPLDTMLAE